MPRITSRIAHASLGAGALAILCAAAFAGSPAKPRKAAAPVAAIPAIQVIPNVPGELNPSGGGAPAATLAQAAAFAWQEFIGLSWPAATTDAQGNPLRDTIDTSCLFGDPGARCAAQPLTWQTLRGKAEIFTNGTIDPNYNSPPNYSGRYPSGDPGPCTGTPSGTTPWVNLDEVTQIQENGMFAGAGPTDTSVNSQPQLIRFLAKANGQEFNYYSQLAKLYGPNPALFAPNPAQPADTIGARTVAYLKNNGNVPPGGTTYIGLPNGTIEIKAGWRMLTAAEQRSGRFHMATVRYYEPTSTGNTPSCYRDGQWGLVALHIIQKTPSAPYFIFASFEQADNITNAAGMPVEDADGAIPGSVLQNCPPGQSAPCPTTPATSLNDTPTVNASHVPPNVVLAPGAGYCQPGKRLYYVNLRKKALPSGGPICINYRYNPIPETIINANRAAHAAISAYNRQKNIQSSPWLYYKLLNVQYFPQSNENPAKPFPGGDPTTGNNPASYYLANILVETNRPLQMFSGSLVLGGGTGSNSNYDSQFGGPPGTAVHRNLYYTAPAGKPRGFNMGGCMGCHGAQGQAAGGDFSVILARGQVDDPELLPPLSTPALAKKRR